jgi:pimeloyl-ACP methyl ester carboxylesterase
MEIAEKAMTLDEQIAGFALRTVATPPGNVTWREAGAASAPALVLLHGIGSASASWVEQLAAARDGRLPLRVLAWDAPGYGASTALTASAPTAADYALRMWAWLDALQVGRIALAGHSLGALMAAAATHQQPARVLSLTLLSPAQGYGRADAALRDSKLNDRLKALETLGPQGMAERRGAAMLSPAATPQQVAFIQGVMAQINPAGYTQAARMLSRGDIAADLQGLACPVTIASGSADTITPPDGCAALASAVGAPYLSLGAVGHACALEAGFAVTTLLGDAARHAQGTTP